MDDEDREAMRTIVEAFGPASSLGQGNSTDDDRKDRSGDEFSFTDLIVKDGRWAKALAKALTAQ
jgi:hypothetical protein